MVVFVVVVVVLAVFAFINNWSHTFNRDRLLALIGLLRSFSLFSLIPALVCFVRNSIETF